MARAYPHSIFKLALLFGATVTLLSYTFAALASDGLDLTQYVHTAWTARVGFKGSTRSIVQTPDGYLWLGTEFGLVRFDGVRFVPWGWLNKRLPSSNITTLLASRDGTLWIGTLNGLASVINSNVTLYPELSEEPIFALLQDHEGTVWIGASGKLCRIRSAHVECRRLDAASSDHANYLYGSHGRAVISLYEDTDRRLWAATEMGLWRWNSDGLKLHISQPTETQQSLVQGDHANGLIVVNGANTGLRQVTGNKVEDYAPPGFTRPFKPLKLFRDGRDALWIGTSQQGVIHVHDGKTTQFAQTNGLSGDLVTAFFEDREGTIWVGTTNGLDRFREPAAFTLSTAQGLSTPAWSILGAQDGSVWIGSLNGLCRWNLGQLTVYRPASAPKPGLVAVREETMRPLAGVSLESVREVADPGLPDDNVLSLLQDQHGRIWVTTPSATAWFENGKFTRLTGVPAAAATAMILDKHEGIWISYPSLGLFHVVENNIIQTVPWPWAKASRQPRISSVAADPLRDGFWLGFLDGGVSHFHDGQIDTSIGVKDGLGANQVWNLQVDSDGTLWAATEGGVSRVKDGHVATLTSKNGLPCDAAHWVVTADDSTLWLYMACGLVRVTRSELNAWELDNNRAIQTTVFDGSDGIRLHASITGYSPLVAKATDGKLWFVYSDGVSAIDPQHLSLNKLAPLVHVEEFTADNKTYSAPNDINSLVRLPAFTRDLEIDYTALSLVAPEKNQFRYKLEGHDPHWQDVGNRRQAFYNDLPPGSYRFRVVASNNSGVWNEQGATLDFSIAPAYWQTNWFRAACVTTFLALLWALYQLRLRQIRHAFNARLEERVGERTRIARDLHDTLLQSFQGLLLRFQTAYALFDTRPADAKEVLGSSIDQTAQAITEGREAVQGLRASTVESNDLTRAITTLAEEIAAEASSHASVELRVGVEGTPRTLHPIVRDEIYRIGSEALRNAFRHAEAKQIEVELRYDERQLRLRIRDDGKGIDPEFLTVEGREGHFGVHGMRERAKLIGGKLAVWTAPGAGTEIELGVPASRAYAASPSPWRSWFTDVRR